MMLANASCGPYLRNWEPGLGEVAVLRSLPPIVQEFARDACSEDPDFLEEYLVPALGTADAPERICDDLCQAVMALELDTPGLGDLGFLGKSLFKRVRSAVTRVHQAIASKVLPKPLQKIDTKVVTAIKKTDEKIAQVAKKVGQKYGNTIISAAGAVLAPFTGGASLAAAAVLVAANTAYQKKRQADAAKKAARKDAAQLEAQAQAADRALQAQVDDFYRQNQDWFLQRGITPDRWARMTLDQKVNTINSGASGSLPVVSSPSGGGGFDAPSAPAGGGDPGGYFGPGGGGGGGDSGGGGGPFSSGGGASAQPQAARAGVMDGGGDMMIPALLVAGAVALSSGGKKGGGRRKRNPGRRRWR